MRCKVCGTEFKEGVFCPECGVKIENTSEMNYGKQNNSSDLSRIKQHKSKEDSRAILALILGVISWIGLMTVIIPIICALISIIKGIQALKGKTKYKKVQSLE